MAEFNEDEYCSTVCCPLLYSNLYILFTFLGEYDKKKLYYGSVHMKDNSVVVFSVKENVFGYIDKFNLISELIIMRKDLIITAIATCAITLATTIPFAIHFTMPYGWARTLTVVAISVILTALVILYVGCSRNERQSILLALKKKLRRA